jgi:hypothetical protein
MKQPKGQHIIPRMYLENWAGPHPAGHVWTYFKKTGHRRSGIPAKTSKISHFYTIQDKEGLPDWQVETLLALIEAKAKAPLHELATTGVIAQTADRENIAAFVASMVFRTSPMREELARRHAWLVENEMRKIAFHDDDFQAVLRRLEESEGRKFDGEEIKKIRATMIDSSGYKLQIPKEIPIEIMLRGINENISTFADMHWAIAYSEKDTLITSDNPVLQFIPPESGKPNFQHPDASLTLPLTSQCLLIMRWSSPPKRRFALSDEAIERENYFRIIQAENEIYANKESIALAEKISDLRDISAFVYPTPGELKSKVEVTRRLRRPT